MERAADLSLPTEEGEREARRCKLESEVAALVQPSAWLPCHACLPVTGPAEPGEPAAGEVGLLSCTAPLPPTAFQPRLAPAPCAVASVIDTLRGAARSAATTSAGEAAFGGDGCPALSGVRTTTGRDVRPSEPSRKIVAMRSRMCTPGGQPEIKCRTTPSWSASAPTSASPRGASLIDGSVSSQYSMRYAAAPSSASHSARIALPPL